MAQLLTVEEVMSDFNTGSSRVAWQLVFVVFFVSIQSKLQGQYSQRILRLKVAFGEVIRKASNLKVFLRIFQKFRKRLFPNKAS